MNIPVLIIQFLYALADGKFESCEERVESLNKYRTRYLNDPETLRSNYFIKLLSLIPAAGFNTEQVRLKSRKIYELLLHTPWESVNANHEVEIIPYENLWTLVLDCLKASGRKSVAVQPWPSLAKTG